MKCVALVGALALAVLLPGAVKAASFDCGKAQSPFERKICSTPTLSAADELLAVMYNARVHDFLIPDFIKDSQRAWLSEARQCLPEAASCLKEYSVRTSTLASYGSAKVYTSYGRSFDHDGVTLVVTERQGGALWLDWYGSWMPDAYNPKPFPEGFLAAGGSELVEKDGGGYSLGFDPRVSLTMSEDKITFLGDGLSLSPRQGPIVGDFTRAR